LSGDLVNPVVLKAMTPAQEESWKVLLEFYVELPAGWCLIGGQMVWLLALERGVEPIRVTEDVDVVVDIRVDQGAITRLCAWLESRGFELEGINTDGVGHRYVSSTYEGPGKVMFDVLAPDNMGERADLTTSPPARTVSAPGTRVALDDIQPVEIVLREQHGRVLRPSLLAAILVKAAATRIPGRENPERDWVDIGFLLSLVADPVGAAADLSKGQRRGLRAISELLDENHWVWRQLGDRSLLGRAALQFLMDV
jgi:hypothetical protein